SLRVEIAACYLDRLADPQKAVDELESLLEESPGHAEACAQLERLLEHEAATLPLRRRALALLRKNYDAADRRDDVIRVLERALRFVGEDERPALYRELGSRLSIAGEDGRAMQHYAALLTIDPGDTDARKQLEQLAERSGQHDLHAASLVAAAEASEGLQQTTLLLEAAHAYRDLLDDKEQAAELYGRVLESGTQDKSAALTAAHSLAEILAEAGEDSRRLDVLETLAPLERVSAVRKNSLGDAARLADRLGQADRAMAIWRRRLEADQNDVEARDAVIELLAANERWEDLVAALRKRAGATVLEQQRRADLVRAARILADDLERSDDAIAVWLEVRESFGDEAETIDALDALMASASRWPDLAEVLSSSAGAGSDRAIRTLTRLGDINREHLDEAPAAARLYAQALGIDPANAAAITGLRALLSVDSCRREAGEALARAFAAAGDWEAGLGILDERIEAAAAPEDKARLLREAAMLYETRAGEPEKAHAAVARALPFTPEDLALEHDLLRLAEETGAWAATAEALEHAATAAQSEARGAQLRFEVGRIHEHRLDEAVAATEAYAAAAAADPRRVESHEAVSRCAARAGRWTECAAAALRAIIARERPEQSIIADLESAAGAAEAWGKLAEAFEKALAEQGSQLRTTLARALHQLAAGWWEKAGAIAKATAAAARAVSLEATHDEALTGLAELQRQNPSPELVETLLRIDALGEHDLDHLHEAAKVALALREAADGDDDGLARQTLVRLYRKAAR
ncbi:MAG: hypothetical protein KC431_26220, partial [Myxococcales bacterium]|nr:hypothetical protein [Myxococcales bacterium]